MSNDPNDVFGKAFIEIYLFGVSNPKGYVHSQPQSHFYMKKLSRSSFCFFVFIFFFIFVRAMSESALKRLRQEAREKEVEKKVQVSRSEQIQKKREWNMFD
jgi:hypothetical protein